jgi:ElaB/YqjD/DUF883 family membrane-anchored ribosome-binding protein
MPNFDERTTGTTGTPGSTGTHGTTGTHGSTGSTGSTGSIGNTGNAGTTGTTGTPGTGTGAATALSQTAQDYGHKITEAATHAKDYVTDKVSVVGDKIKDLQNADLGELAENAKQYARQKPGQALLISAAAGLLLGLILRGGRR